MTPTIYNNVVYKVPVTNIPSVDAFGIERELLDLGYKDPKDFTYHNIYSIGNGSIFNFTLVIFSKKLLGDYRFKEILLDYLLG